eukprot:scaffold261394_cov45-Tisochrysis_lutea.AAC.1
MTDGILDSRPFARHASCLHTACPHLRSSALFAFFLHTLKPQEAAGKYRKEDASNQPDASAHSLTVIRTPVAGPPDARDKVEPHAPEDAYQDSGCDEAAHVACRRAARRAVAQERHTQDQ